MKTTNNRKIRKAAAEKAADIIIYHMTGWDYYPERDKEYKKAIQLYARYGAAAAGKVPAPDPDLDRIVKDIIYMCE